MIAVAVSNEDVSQVSILAGDPVAESTRLIRRERGICQHRILAPVDQGARHRGATLRFSVRKQASAVIRRRIVHEHFIGEAGRVGGHDAVLPP